MEALGVNCVIEHVIAAIELKVEGKMGLWKV